MLEEISAGGDYYIVPLVGIEWIWVLLVTVTRTQFRAALSCSLAVSHLLLHTYARVISACVGISTVTFIDGESHFPICVSV